MRIRSLILWSLILVTPELLALTVDKQRDINYTIAPEQMSSDRGVYASDLTPLLDWLTRGRAEVALELLPGWYIKALDGDLSEVPEGVEQGDEEVEVFEAKSAFVLPHPPSYYSKDKVYNVDMVKKSNPENTHEILSQSPQIVVKTTASLPGSIVGLVEAARSTGYLQDHDPYLSMKSAWSYFGQNELQSSEAAGALASAMTKDFGVAAGSGQVMLLQDFYSFNQAVLFGRSVVVLVPIAGDKTLALANVTLGIEKDVLAMKLGPVAVRSVMMGQVPGLNRGSGILSGMPNYVEHLMTSMAQTLGGL